MTNNVLLMVIDAFGLDTFEYLLDNYAGKVNMPNLSRLGLGNLLGRNRGRLPAGNEGHFAKIRQVSATADSLVGHREMTGVRDGRTYDLFHDGFPAEYLAEIEKKTGRKTFFNKMAGGMEAIELNAGRHEETGDLIVYASKCDPLIQIAMNEKVVPVAEQHKIADAAFEAAMEMKVPITRAIARSYVRNENGEFVRTSNRHDAVLPVGQKTLVDILREENVWTCAVGKTADLVNVEYHETIKLKKKEFIDPTLGIRFVHLAGKDTNPFNLQGIINALAEGKAVYRPKGTFIFANLVDTDSVYGHTRDVEGSLECVEEIDRFLPAVMERMDEGDLLLITADHGMEHRHDYGYHSNENLFLLGWRKGRGADLGVETGKSPGLLEVGSLAAQFFGAEKEYSRITAET